MPGITLCLPAYPLLLRPSFRVLPVTVFLTSGEHAMSALLCFSFVFGHDASVIHGALFTLVNRDPVHWVTTLRRFWNFENFLDRIWIEGTFLKDQKVNVERFKIYSNIGMRFLSSFLFFFVPILCRGNTVIFEAGERQNMRTVQILRDSFYAMHSRNECAFFRTDLRVFPPSFRI